MAETVWIIMEDYTGNFCGVFSTKKRAEAKLKRNQNFDGFDGYSITEFYIDKLDEQGYCMEVKHGT